MTTSILFPALLFLVTVVVLYIYLGIVGKPNEPLAVRRLIVGDASFDVEIANTTTTRVRGLSFRKSLAEGRGMLFLFSPSAKYGLWMKDMRFPIDIVWIAGDKVVDVSENAKVEEGKNPFNFTIYRPSVDVDKVLEIGAGEFARLGLRVGDSVATPNK